VLTRRRRSSPSSCPRLIAAMFGQSHDRSGMRTYQEQSIASTDRGVPESGRTAKKR
jgi:hypothetical protein